MWKDPIVEEVRAARRQIEAECGGDSKLLAERARRVQQEYANRVVTREHLSHRRSSRKTG